MPALTEVILALTIVVLTALLTVLGIEVFYILKDIRKLLDRATHVMDDAEQIAGHIKKPTEMVASITHGAELFTKLFDAAKTQAATEIKSEPKKEPVVIVEQKYTRETMDDEFEPVEIKRQPMPQPQSPTLGRRYFRMPRRPVS